jgi:hypothetical protein
MKTRRRQRTELMPPRIPALRKAVSQQNRRSAPLLCDVHADAIGFDDAVRYLGHRDLRRLGLILRFSDM